MARPPCDPPLPYTTLFRSVRRELQRKREERAASPLVRDPSCKVVERGRVEPISVAVWDLALRATRAREELREQREVRRADRKSTRLNSSHMSISYAVFCLK